MKPTDTPQPELQSTVSLWRKLEETGWQEVRRYNRYALHLPDDWLEQTDRPAISHVTCPGCGKRMARMYMNLLHECPADLEQPDYTPAYRLREARRRNKRRAEWKRKQDTTLAARYGITIQETENSYVVEFSQVKNLNHTGSGDLVRIVPKSAKK
jgi:hypothetical protein